MSVTVVVLAAVIILATHFIGAVTGYGSTLLALPVLAWLLGDVKTAMVTLLIAGTLQAYQVLFYCRKHVNWVELRRILLWAGIGLPIGYASMRFLPQKSLLLGLGTVLIASGASRLRRNSEEVDGGPPRAVLNGLLFVGGIIHGAFASGGATLAVYAQHALGKKDAIRGTLTMVWVILNTILLANLFSRGQVTEPEKYLVLVSLPFLILGNWLGELTARKLGQRHFMQWMATLLVVAGAITIVRAALRKGA